MYIDVLILRKETQNKFERRLLFVFLMEILLSHVSLSCLSTEYLLDDLRLVVSLDVDCIHANRISLNIHQYVHHFLIIKCEVLSVESPTACAFGIKQKSGEREEKNPTILEIETQKVRTID